jgi:DNA-binding transcriptional LysR family regulator
MPVKMHQVFYFVALCEEQSFTRAANRCGVAQPSLTRAIQTLEEEFGGYLFERSRSNVRLTQLGLLVRADFERISQATTALAQKITEFKAAPSFKTEPTSAKKLENQAVCS